MKNIFTDDKAISYSIITIAVILVYMSVFWVGMAEVIDTFSVQQDDAIADGTVSEQTQKFYNLSVNIFKSTMVFGIIGLVLYGIRQSKFDTEIRNTSMFPLFSSTTIMLVMSFVSVLLVFAFAHPLDMILNALVTSGLIDFADVNESNAFMVVDLFYFACILPSMIGIAIHLLTSVEKIGYSLSEEQKQTEFNDDFISAGGL